MTLSISQIKNPPTRSEIVAWMIERAQELGFQATGWQEGRLQNTFLNIVATGVSFLAQSSADTVKNSYNESASGSGLALRSRNTFDNEKVDAVKAAGPMTFTSTGTVAHVLSVGQIIVQDVNGVQFTNTEADTVPAGGAVDIDMKALLAGANGSIPNNSTLTLITPLAGVTVTNPGPGDVDLDGFDDPWYTFATGADPETDVTLRERNATKWGLLSIEKTSTGVKNLALSQTGINKAKVIHNNPRGAGTVDVYVASGGVLTSTADKEAAQANFADYFMGTEAVWPPTHAGEQSRYEIFDPPTLKLDIRGVVYYDPQYTAADVQDNLTQSLGDFVTLMPIGGRVYGGAGLVTIGDIHETMEGTTGVRSVTLTTPSGNVAVGDTQLVTAPADWITGRLTFSAVTS